MNITNDIVLQRSLRWNIDQVERKLFDAQPRGEGYLHTFVHQFNVTWKCEPDIEISQVVIVTGRATCNCSLGFNIYIDKIEAREV